MKRSIIWFTLVCSMLCIAQSQDVYLSSRHEVYSFLKRMEAKSHLTDYRDAAKPFSRRAIAKFLNTLRSSTGVMTPVELETYRFFLEEFSAELAFLPGDREPGAGRKHAVELPLHQGILYADPNLGVVGKTRPDGKVYVLSYGLKTYGYLDNTVGYYFDLTFHREGGSARDILKYQTPEPGIIVQRGQSEFFEYNTTEAQVTFGWNDFRFSIEKMHNVWGLGRRGSIILSDKAPSYPQIKLRVPVSDWMDFIYVHGELHSNVIDSSRSYRANSSQLLDFFRTVYRSKYIAAHQIEFTPIDGLDISIGESVVYSDKGPQFIYLIPIMLFKSAEHYNRDTDNVQIFASVDVNLIRNANGYLSVFIDEINTEKLADPTESRNQAGFTGGLQLYDIGIEDSELLVEYTRLNPWVYTHKFPAATFTNNGYDLGHWIGQNSDHLFAELAYRFSRPLRVSGFFERVRNGGLQDIVGQYSPPSEEFLYGPVKRTTSFGLTGEYQFVRDGFLTASLRWNTITDEARPARNQTGQLEVFLGTTYGL